MNPPTNIWIFYLCSHVILITLILSSTDQQTMHQTAKKEVKKKVNDIPSFGWILSLEAWSSAASDLRGTEVDSARTESCDPRITDRISCPLILEKKKKREKEKLNDNSIQYQHTVQEGELVKTFSSL